MERSHQSPFGTTRSGVEDNHRERPKMGVLDSVRPKEGGTREKRKERTVGGAGGTHLKQKILLYVLPTHSNPPTILQKITLCQRLANRVAFFPELAACLVRDSSLFAMSMQTVLLNQLALG